MYYVLNIETYEENTLIYKETKKGLIEDDILSYTTDIDNIKIYLKNFKLIKESTETIFILTNNLCTLKLKELNNIVEIPIDYIKYNYNKNKYINIEYRLISQEKPLKIYIEMSEENDIEN